MEDNDLQNYNRKILSFKDFGRFKMPERTYNNESCNIYTARLNDLREEILMKAKFKWANYSHIEISRLTLEESPEKSYILIGILYKEQKLKPSLLREFSKELQLEPQPNKNYASIDDVLFLEDETSRIKLTGNHMNIQDIVTGLVCSVLGHEQENGTFWVEDWCFPGYCPKPCMSSSPLIEDGKILIVSGLDLVNNTDDLSLDLFLEWVTGMAGLNNAQKEETAIAKIIIAGNSIRSSAKVYYKGYSEAKSNDQLKIKEDIIAMRKLDSFLSNILHCCCVMLMPGEFDPTCHCSMPQQPFHPCTLEKSSRFKSMYSTTNPWIGNIGGRIIAGSCGSPIIDIMKVAGLSKFSSLEWLERTLIWRHYAPTGPDTLPVYPSFKNDPFVMTECPDIYFAGNMEEYDTKLVTADEGQIIRLICVPKFSETRTAVLVNLYDLTTQAISFSCG